MHTRVVLTLAVLVTIAQAAFAENTATTPTIELQGICSYAIDCPNDSATIKITSIVNIDKKKASETIKYCLMLTNSVYKGENKITGWPVYEASLDPLATGKQYANIATTQRIGKEPKTGRYYVTLLLLEERYGQYGIVSFVSFDGMIDFKNTKEDPINAKLAELNEAQRKYDYYTMRSQSSDIDTMTDNTMQAMNVLTTIGSLKMELYYLGYNTENPAESTYIDSPLTYKAFTDIVDERPSTPAPLPAPAYAPTPSYTPGNGRQSESSSGSHADSKSNWLLQDAQQNLADAKIKLNKDQAQYDLDHVKYEGDLYILDSEIEQIQEDNKQVLFYENLVYKLSSQ
jgi:hypothetical protein